MSQEPRASQRRRLARWGLAALLLLGFWLAWFLGILRPPKPELGPSLSPYARIAHPEVAEASGLVQSDTNPDILWLHNDSGDRPRLFAISPQGEVLVRKGSGEVNHAPKAGERLYQGIAVTGAKLVDWEDITCHRDRLYIAEMGNNLNNRRDLGVYEVQEPDPGSSESVEALAFIPVCYPDQTAFPPSDKWDFDCEATFWWRGHLYFVTKSRPAYRVYVQGSRAGLYRLDSMDPKRKNVLTKVDQAQDLGGWVTAAAVSHDERFLAILIESPISSVWLFERPPAGDRFFSQSLSIRRMVFHGAGQLESLAFYRSPDGQEQILLLNEERDLFRLSLDKFEAVRLSAGAGPDSGRGFPTDS